MPIDEIRRDNAKKILESKGYVVIGYLGQGAYNTVFKCKKDGNVVAARVVSGNKEAVVAEKYAAKIFEGRNLSLIELKSDKQFYKYLNIPTKSEHDEDNWCIIESTLAEGDLEERVVEDPEDSATRMKKLRGEGVIKKLNEVRRIFKNALKGLKALHDKDLVHLDIKPANILRIEATGKAGNRKYNYQLSDFGSMISKSQVKEQAEKLKENIEGLREFIEKVAERGTDRYSPPEFRNLKNCSDKDLVQLVKHIKKADIYALGVTMFEIYISIMWPGSRMNDDDLKNLEDQNYNNLVKGNRAMNQKEKDLLNVIAKCIDKEPEKRPKAKELLALPIISREIT